MIKSKNFKLLLSFLIIFSFHSASHARNSDSNYPLDFYFAAGVGKSEIKSNSIDEDIEINASKLKAGLFFHKNIALELSFGQGLKEESLEDDNTEFEINNWMSTLIRLQSPHIKGFRIYLQGGYSEIEISLTDTLTFVESEDTLNGATWSAGIEQRMYKNLPLWFYLDYTRVNDETRFSIVDAGLRYSFD